MNAQVNDARSKERERAAWDRLVNDQWNGSMPILSDQETIGAAKRLYRMAMKKPLDGGITITSGNRYTWGQTRRVWDHKKPRGSRSRIVTDLKVNPNRDEPHCRGLRAMIHDLSHYCHRRLHPNDSGHSSRQLYLERDMTAYAIKHGFAEGSLKSKAAPKEKPDRIQKRYQAMINRRDKWAKELARAKRLHAKAESEVRSYERRHGDRLISK